MRAVISIFIPFSTLLKRHSTPNRTRANSWRRDTSARKPGAVSGNLGASRGLTVVRSNSCLENAVSTKKMLRLFTSRNTLLAVKRKRYTTVDAYLIGTGTTQRALAEQLGITQGALSMIKNGQRMPRADLALRIHAVTGVPLETLLTRQAVV